jgi:hypothetical protein
VRVLRLITIIDNVVVIDALVSQRFLLPDFPGIRANGLAVVLHDEPDRK